MNRMSLISIYLATFLCCVVCIKSNAQDAQTELSAQGPSVSSDELQTSKNIVTDAKVKQIESFIEQNMQQINVPGVSVGIFERGVPMVLKGFGVSNSNGEVVNANTPFKLGSVSKSFTALAIMQLHEDGVIALNEPVVKYIPWFRSYDKVKSDRILVKHLMNHTSGFSTVDGNRNQHSRDQSSDALRVAVSELSEVKLETPSGESFQYSNINYQVLGYLLEVLEKDSFEAVLERRIFRPLNMKNSSAYRQAGQIEKKTEGYLLSYGSPHKFDDQLGRTTIPQGGIYSSAEDMLIYLSHYLKTDSSIIHDKTKQQMIAGEGDGTPFGYGFGWYFFHQEDYRLIYHSGVSAGYETGVLFSPELDIAVVVLTNASSGFGLNNVSGIVSGVGNILLDGPSRNVDAHQSEKIILWAILLIPMVIFVFALRFIRNYRMGSIDSLQRPFNLIEIFIRVVLPLIILFGISYLLLIVLPELNGATLSAVKLFQPLVFWMIVIISSIAVSWGVVRTLLVLRVKN
jgi:CubicO group peptidase (beta-lactamase class C family)